MGFSDGSDGAGFHCDRMTLAETRGLSFQVRGPAMRTLTLSWRPRGLGHLCLTSPLEPHSWGSHRNVSSRAKFMSLERPKGDGYPQTDEAK